jgi:hypothetical protein
VSFESIYRIPGTWTFTSWYRMFAVTGTGLHPLLLNARLFEHSSAGFRSIHWHEECEEALRLYDANGILSLNVAILCSCAHSRS